MSDLLRSPKSASYFVIGYFVCAHVFTNMFRRQNSLSTIYDKYETKPEQKRDG